MANISFQAPTDYSTEAADIERRRKYAELLQQQSMEGVPLPQTPAGGFTPNISWTQGLAQMLKGYAGRKGLDEATARSKALADRFRTEGQDTLQRGMRAYQGTPGSSEQIMDETANGGEGQMAQINAPGVAGNPGAAMAIMGGHPMTQGFSGALMAQMLKAQDPYTLAPGAVRMGPGNAPVAAAPFKPEPFTLAPGATRFGPDNKPVAAMPKEDELARALQAAGVDLKSPAAQALFQERAVKIATHAPPTRVNVAQNVSTEKKYGEKFAGEIAQSDALLRDAATRAPELADRANRIKKVLAEGNTITGFGADFRLGFGKAASLAGIKMAEDAAANTETLASGLAQNTMDAIKASGMGGGTGFSNADRDFLEKAVGGKINLEAKAISRLADLAHRAASLTANRWSTRVKEIPASALEGTGIKADQVMVAPLFGGAPAAGGLPDASAIDAEIARRRGTR